jgi:soluble lytic murein transglycosylase-like protein
MPWIAVFVLGAGAAFVGHWLASRAEKDYGKGSGPGNAPLIPPLKAGVKMSTLQAQGKVLADKWGVIFNVPPAWVMSIMDLESGFHPEAKNLTERALPLGGAWGLMMVTLNTAKGIGNELRTFANPDVQRLLQKWTGKGEDLLDPELGSMFGSYYLSKLYREFHTFPLVSAAYQQGPGAIRKAIAGGKRIPEDLPPHGKEYVMLAGSRLGKYA